MGLGCRKGQAVQIRRPGAAWSATMSGYFGMMTRNAADALRYRPLPARSGTGTTALVTPAFTGMATVEADRAATYPLHQHHDHEVIIPLRGTYRCRLGAARLALGPDQALVVKPGDWHEDLLGARTRHVGVWFTLGRTALFTDGVTPVGQVATLPPGTGQELVRRLLVEQDRSDRFSGRMQEALCHQLFWLLVRALPTTVLATGFLAADADDTFRQRLVALFEARHRGALPLADMAAHLHQSERTVNNRCRRLFGHSPAKAFAAHRLARARDLLLQTSLSVKEVAAHIGFDDAHHFSRAYTRWFGHPPSLRSS